jgi:protein-disulfide isomerase
MKRRELKYVEYLIKKFQRVKDKKPIFNKALQAMEEQRALLLSSKTDPQRPPRRGGEDAKVTIIEFMDFECPPCKKATKTIGEILKTHGEKVRLVFRNYPRVEKHPLAVKAAEAALCAHEQGKFWEYYELLFENQKNLDVGNLIKLAESLGLEMQAFQSCLISGEKARRVIEDLELGRELGVNRVPTFFINGIKIEGNKPIEEFHKIIQRESQR